MGKLVETSEKPPIDEEHRVFVRNRGRQVNDSDMLHVSFVTTRAIRSRGERELSRQERERRKRVLVRYWLPKIIEYMNDWSTSVACAKVHLNYQMYRRFLREHPEFETARIENIKRHKRGQKFETLNSSNELGQLREHNESPKPFLSAYERNGKVRANE